jgi:hypothetical protein
MKTAAFMPPFSLALVASMQLIPLQAIPFGQRCDRHHTSTDY